MPVGPHPCPEHTQWSLLAKVLTLESEDLGSRRLLSWTSHLPSLKLHYFKWKLWIVCSLPCRTAASEDKIRNVNLLCKIWNALWKFEVWCWLLPPQTLGLVETLLHCLLYQNREIILCWCHFSANIVKSNKICKFIENTALLIRMQLAQVKIAFNVTIKWGKGMGVALGRSL